MKVLVAFASTHGSTADIASRIADTLGTPDVTVDLRHVADVLDVSGYDAAVIGSAVYFGRWLPVAEQFAAQWSDSLRRVPVWMFSSGPVAAGDLTGIDPAAVDELVHATAAVEHVVFAGRLSGDTLTWREHETISTTSAKAGDFREWTEIEQWAQRIGRRLFSAASHPARTHNQRHIHAVADKQVEPLTADERHLLIGAVQLAPSFGNAQPWRVSMQKDGLVEVRADRPTGTAAAGPLDRSVLIGCGAAVEFSRLAIRGMGRAADVAVFPDANDPGLVARIQPDGPSRSGADDRVLVSAMTHRTADDTRTHLPPLLIDELRAAAERHGLYVRCIDTPADVAVVIAGLSDARLQRVMTCANACASGGAHHCGHDDSRPVTRAPDWPQDLFGDAPTHEGDTTTQHPGSGGPGTLMLIVGTDDRPLTHVATGRAVAWMLLRIAAEGLSSNPLGEATTDASFRQRLTHDLRLIGHAQFLLGLPYVTEDRHPAPRSNAGARR